MLFDPASLPCATGNAPENLTESKREKPTFFDERQKHSEIKTRIVTKYFGGWTRVLQGWADKLAYIDPYSGPGYYDDGSPSTPILIMRAIIADDVLVRRVVTIFNDKDPAHVRALDTGIKALPGYERLVHKPQVEQSEVDATLAEQLSSVVKVPTLFFVDPFGYAGLTIDLIYSVLKDWGCDCIFFFNYDGINRALVNDTVRDHMDAIFGRDRVTELRRSLSLTEDQDAREELILNALSEALAEIGGKYMHTFRFRRPNGRRHHLVFVSKNFRGYEIMKEVMASESSVSYQGVPTYEYVPEGIQVALPLAEEPRPLDRLKQDLLREYSGKVRRVEDVYREHSVGRPYIERNYKMALRQLLDDEKVTYHRDPHRPKLRGNTMPGDTWIHFPS